MLLYLLKVPGNGTIIFQHRFNRKVKAMLKVRLFAPSVKHNLHHPIPKQPP